MDAALAAGEAMLAEAATQIDADPFDRSDTAQLLARRTRAIVEHAVDEAITRLAGHWARARYVRTADTLNGSLT